MRRILATIPFLFLIVSLRAGQLPMTVKEIGLMLRAGYSNASVMQDLAQRHFADTLDPDKETMLLKAGASQELIDGLNRGKYSLSPEETARLNQQMADVAARKAAETERVRRSSTLYQAQVARERTAHPSSNEHPNFVSETVKDDLVRCVNGSVVHADGDELADKKLIAIYFSAHWCGPCRKFTPELVDYYNRVAPLHPEFEVLFFSCDRDAFAMQTYMHDTNMPWPAIDFSKLPEKGALRRYAGNGIPCLVVIDASGKVVSDSFAGKEYRGPHKVLADLDSIFARGGVAANP